MAKRKKQKKTEVDYESMSESKLIERINELKREWNSAKREARKMSLKTIDNLLTQRQQKEEEIDQLKRGIERIDHRLETQGYDAKAYSALKINEEQIGIIKNLLVRKLGGVMPEAAPQKTKQAGQQPHPRPGTKDEVLCHVVSKTSPMGSAAILEGVNDYIAKNKPIFGMGRGKGKQITKFKDNGALRVSLDYFECFDSQGTRGRGKTWIYRAPTG